METEAKYTFVGLFVLTFLVAGILFIMWAARVSLTKNQIDYDIYFKGAVTGLNQGSMVRFNGVPVGAVNQIVLDPKDTQRIRVRVSIDKVVPIRNNVYALLEVQGITGIKFVQLKGGTLDAPFLTGDPGHPAVISSKRSGLEELFNSIPSTLHEIKSLVQNTEVLFVEVSKMLKENREGLKNLTSTGVVALTKFLEQANKTFATYDRIGELLERSPKRFLLNDPEQGVKVP